MTRLNPEEPITTGAMYPLMWPWPEEKKPVTLLKGLNDLVDGVDHGKASREKVWSLISQWATEMSKGYPGRSSEGD